MENKTNGKEDRVKKGMLEKHCLVYPNAPVPCGTHTQAVLITTTQQQLKLILKVCYKDRWNLRCI